MFIFLYQTVCVFSQIKYKKTHIKQTFHSVTWVMPQFWDLGVLVVKDLSLGILDGAPSTEGSS